MNDIYYYTNSKGEVVEATYSQVEEASKHFGYPDAQTYMTDKGITTDPPAEEQEPSMFSGEETKDAIDKSQDEQEKIQQERDETRKKDLDNRISNEKPKVNKSMSQIVREAKMKETTEKAIELDDAHTWMDNVDDVQFSNSGNDKMSVMLNEAYPGFTAKEVTKYKTDIGPDGAVNLPYTELEITDDATGDTKTIDPKSNSFKTDVRGFVNKHGGTKKYQPDEETLKLSNEASEATSLSGYQNSEIQSITQKPNEELFKPYTEMETVQGIPTPDGRMISGSRRVEKTIQPYEAELKQAKDILDRQVVDINAKRSPSDQVPAATRLDIENKAKDLIAADMTYKMQDNNLQDYLEDLTESEIAKLNIYTAKTKDAKSKKASEVLAVQKIEMDNFLDENKNPDLMLVNYVNSTLADPTQEFLPEEGEKTIKLNNGKVIGEKLYNEYIQAKSNLDNQLVPLKKRQDEINKITGEVSDLNTKMDLYGRDYSNMSKFTYNFLKGFESIGSGILYYGGRLGSEVMQLGGGLTGLAGEVLQKNLTDWQVNRFKEDQDRRKVLAKDVSFGDFKDKNGEYDAGRFGRFINQEVSTQLPILASMVVTGGSGSAVLPALTIGTYSAGERLAEFDVNQATDPNYNPSALEKWFVSTGYGALDGTLGTLPTARILRNSVKAVGTSSTSGFLSFGKEFKNAWTNGTLRKNVIYEPAIDMAGEVGTTWGQNALDGRPILTNTGHTAFTSGMFSIFLGGGPLVYGHTLTAFSDRKKWKETRSLIDDKNRLEAKLSNVDGRTKVGKAYKNQITSLEKQIENNINTVSNNVNNKLSPKSYNAYVDATKRQEEIRLEAEAIVDDQTIKNRQDKQEQLKYLKKEFDDIQYARDLWRDEDAFGNEFNLLSSGNEQQKERYQRIKQEAITKLRVDKNKAPNFQPDAKDINAAAYDIYVREEIQDRIDQANKASNNFKTIVLETKEDAINEINRLTNEEISIAASEEKTTIQDTKTVIDKINKGSLNGFQVGKNNYAIMENAVANEKTEITIHEPGHQVFEEILQNRDADFSDMANSVLEWTKANNPAVYKRLSTQAGVNLLLSNNLADRKRGAEEVVVEFLEEVSKEKSFNFDRIQDKELAAYFSYMASDMMQKNTSNNFALNLKGQNDAVSFLVTLATKIKRGDITQRDIQEARQSPVIKAIEQKTSETTAVELAAKIKPEVGSIKESVSETAEEKASRRERRDKNVKRLYDEAPKTKQEFKEFLQTPEGKSDLGEILVDYYQDMLAITKGDVDKAVAGYQPLIKHIEAFDPTVSTDLTGYIGTYLKAKVGTGAKRVAKSEGPKGGPRIGEQRDGGRAFDLADTRAKADKTVDLNLRQLADIKEGSDLYNFILDKTKKVLSTFKPKVKGLNAEILELAKNPKDSKAITQVNKAYKSIRQQLNSDFDTEMFKEIKNTIKKPSYKSWLENNKKAILSLDINNLVAFERLSKNKIFAVAEKKDMSPSEIDAALSVGRKDDLVYINPTSGPTLYKRLDPSPKQISEFFLKRGRDNALAKAIASKLGENATMQALKGEVGQDKAKVIEIFSDKNPDLNWIPLENLLQMFGKITDQGLDSKLSEDISTKLSAENYKKFAAGQDTFIKSIVDIAKNQGIPKDDAERKALIGDLFDGNYPDLKQKAAVVNYFNKILRPYAVQTSQYSAVKIDLDTYINEVLTDDTIDRYADFYGLKNGAKIFAEQAITKQRPFVKTIANIMKANYKNPLDLAAKFWHYKAMLEDGSANPGRSMTFFSETGGSHVKVFIDEFIAPVFSTTENPIVEIKNIKKAGEVEFKFKDGTTQKVKSLRREAQKTTQQMVDGTISKEELDRRAKDADRAFNFVVEVYEGAKKANPTKENLFMLSAGMGANMKGPIRAAARLRYLPVNAKYKKLTRPDGKKAFEYEHGIPAVIVNLAIADAVLNDNSKIDLKKLKDTYSVGIISVEFNDNFGRFFKSRMPFNYKIGDMPTTRWYNEFTRGGEVHELLDVVEGETIGTEETNIWNATEEAKAVNDIDLSNNVFKMSEELSNEDVINLAGTIDEALKFARDPKAPVKKIRVFDFDDTLATSNNIVIAKRGDEEIKLNAEDFAERGLELKEEGYTMDFSDFNKVTDGGRGPLFKIAEAIRDARGNEDLFVLTARAPESQQAIYDFLKAEGLEFKKKNIIGLGNSTGAAKAKWIVEQAAKGYNDFYFADDAYQNVKAVKDALSVIDVKSKVQQAKFKFSENVDEDFNKIIENNFSIGRQKEYSAAKAKTIGASKGKGKFWIPYSAEDFQGLIYKLLGKGKEGDTQMAWFKQNLLQPYTRAMNSLAAARVNLLDDFRALKKALNIPKDLQKTNESGFSNEQAVRVSVWTKLGYEIEGLSKADQKELNDIVNKNENLKLFRDELITLTKGSEYIKPGESWLAGTITTDLIDTLNTTVRSKLLKEQGWTDNVDLIFSDKNLNKLEAIYGPRYVEALRNSIMRMKQGKNRLFSGNRLSNRMLDYINNATGVVMFLNARSAILQTISSLNFINWSFNNPYNAGKAFANQSQYWKDFKKLMNSDYLKDRRNGLRINISESEIANAAKTGKNKAKSAISYILSKGYAPTQIADSFAIASGGATWYRNRVKDLMKRNSDMSLKQAEDQALVEWRDIAEESQQSSDPSKISSQQASDAGRLILAFQNTPMQYARLQKRAAQDLINGRGDAKSNVSKIIYYAVVQNLIFNALQQAIFALGADDSEEKKDKKYFDIAGGMIDSTIRGLGIGGVAIATVKNFLLDIYERSKRKRPEYTDSVWKLLQFSPPISSKISRLRQAAWQLDSKKRRKQIMEMGPFDIDNPAYEASTKVISAVTNVPLDRVLSKYKNLEGAMSEEAEWWQTVAMIAGWPEWQIMPKDSKKSASEKPKVKRKFANPFK
jgi:predicted ABC-type ATPase